MIDCVSIRKTPSGANTYTAVIALGNGAGEKLPRWLLFVALWFWLSLAAPGSLQASTNSLLQYTARLWQMEDGMPHTIVQALAQTRNGYLWVGTREGLARFDGVRFTVVELGSRLIQPSVTALLESRDGSLWIGTDNAGVFRLLNGSLQHFSSRDGLRGDDVQALAETGDGSIWVAVSGRLARIKDGKIQRPLEKQLTGPFSSLFVDQQGVLWIAGPGLRQWQNEKLSGYNPAQGRFPGFIKYIGGDREGTLWTGDGKGVGCVRSNSFTFFSKGNNPAAMVDVICPDDAGNIWVGAYTGLSRLVNGNFVEESGVATGSRVFAILEDRERNVWVGSEEGLTRLTPRRFMTYTKQNGLALESITSVCAAGNDGVWVAVWGAGVSHVGAEGITTYTTTNGLSTDYVLGLREARDGSLWIGADYWAALNHLKDGKVTRYDRAQGWVDAVATVLLDDHDGNLWIGARDALVRLRDDHFTHYTTRDGLSHNKVNALCERAGGGVWLGTEGGLTRWAAERFTLEPAITASILSLYEDPQGVLWIGTRGSGLLRFKERRLATFTSRDGLFSDSIYGIMEDERTNLWFSSSKGIFRVPKSQFAELETAHRSSVTSVRYGKDDGIVSSSQYREVNQPACCKDSSGRLWFRSTQGVVMVDPRELTPNEPPPPVVIEEVLSDRKAVPSGLRTLEIPPGRGELEIHYTALNLRAPENVKFRYQLEGVDPDWMEAGNRRVAYYNHLAPGSYRFRVSAANSEGVWNEREATVAFALQPHYWQTWWFLGACVLAAATLLAAAVRLATGTRMRRKLKRLEEEHALETERARIARDLHDNLGTRLTEILMLNDFLLLHANQGEATLRPALEKGSTQVRELAQNLDAIVWAANPKNDSLDNFILYIYEYLDHLASVSSVRILRDVPAELPDCRLSAAQRHNLFLVLKEALNNVFKHSQATEIWFRARQNDGSLVFQLEDNGKGFLREATSELGNGLLNMEKRMKLIHGTFSVVAQPGAGTRVRLEMPVEQSVASAP